MVISIFSEEFELSDVDYIRIQSKFSFNPVHALIISVNGEEKLIESSKQGDEILFAKKYDYVWEELKNKGFFRESWGKPMINMLKVKTVSIKTKNQRNYLEIELSNGKKIFTKPTAKQDKLEEMLNKFCLVKNEEQIIEL